MLKGYRDHKYQIGRNSALCKGLFSLFLLYFAPLCMLWADSASEFAKLASSSPESGGKYGETIAIDGDIMVIGAPYEDLGGYDRGSVYIYKNSGNTWDF